MSKESRLTLLILGSGGREHSLARACQNSPHVDRIIAAPGNGGLMKEFECHPLNLEDSEAGVALAKEVGADLVLIGPEVPLSLGFADALREAGIPTYGPGKKASQLEASKAFAKDFLTRHQIPTATHRTFSDLEEARAYLQKHSFPAVIKASGLAAGKGVIIAHTMDEAESVLQSMLDGSAFGESGKEIVIENYLEGEEVSIHLLISGDTWIMLPPSQDHKKAGEGDTGPNTGGMGAYAPADIVTEAVNREIHAGIIKPTLEGLRRDGIDYRGTLYIGLMLTQDGPKVIEFNVRFGDPETQVILPLIADDLVELFLLCAEGKPLPEKVHLHPAYAMVVILASKGYPGSYPKGEIITLPEQIMRSASVVHAGTRLNENYELVTDGGRVLGIIGTGPTLKIAAQKSYEAAEQIHFHSKYFRKDIGWRQLKRRRK